MNWRWPLLVALLKICACTQSGHKLSSSAEPSTINLDGSSRKIYAINSSSSGRSVVISRSDAPISKYDKIAWGLYSDAVSTLRALQGASTDDSQAVSNYRRLFQQFGERLNLPYNNSSEETKPLVADGEVVNTRGNISFLTSANSELDENFDQSGPAQKVNGLALPKTKALIRKANRTSSILANIPRYRLRNLRESGASNSKKFTTKSYREYDESMHNWTPQSHTIVSAENVSSSLHTLGNSTESNQQLHQNTSDTGYRQSTNSSVPRKTSKVTFSSDIQLASANGSIVSKRDPVALPLASLVRGLRGTNLKAYDRHFSSFRVPTVRPQISDRDFADTFTDYEPSTGTAFPGYLSDSSYSQSDSSESGASNLVLLANHRFDNPLKIPEFDGHAFSVDSHGKLASTSSSDESVDHPTFWNTNPSSTPSFSISNLENINQYNDSASVTSTNQAGLISADGEWSREDSHDLQQPVAPQAGYQNDLSSNVGLLPGTTGNIYYYYYPVIEKTFSESPAAVTTSYASDAATSHAAPVSSSYSSSGATLSEESQLLELHQVATAVFVPLVFVAGAFLLLVIVATLASPSLNFGRRLSDDTKQTTPDPRLLDVLETPSYTACNLPPTACRIADLWLSASARLKRKIFG